MISDNHPDHLGHHGLCFICSWRLSPVLKIWLLATSSLSFSYWVAGSTSCLSPCSAVMRLGPRSMWEGLDLGFTGGPVSGDHGERASVWVRGGWPGAELGWESGFGWACGEFGSTGSNLTLGQARSLFLREPVWRLSPWGSAWHSGGSEIGHEPGAAGLGLVLWQVGSWVWWGPPVPWVHVASLAWELAVVSGLESRSVETGFPITGLVWDHARACVHYSPDGAWFCGKGWEA